MKHGDVILSDTKDVCNEFNIYFSSVFNSSSYIKSNFVSSSKVNLNHIYTECPKNGVLTVHYGVEEITVNVRKMLKKFYWTYLLIWRSVKVALNRSIILKYMYEIVMTATSNCT
jgi:hypothetical protein